MKYLLDTDIISEPTRDVRDKQVMAWLESVPHEDMYISILTIGEIRKGIERLPESKKRLKLMKWFEGEFLVWFNFNILPIDLKVAEKWGHLTVKSPMLPAVDGLIAATAIAHNLTLVTHFTDDFYDVDGLELLNPWELSANP